jgi:threonine 3-dehydrogenase
MMGAMIMGGNVSLLGLPSDKIQFDLSKAIFKALNLKAIYGREIFETWYKGMALIESGLNVENVITHKFHYSEFEQAFELLNAGKAGKVVLTWD